MKKEREKIELLPKDTSKKINLRIANKKYALTIDQGLNLAKGNLDPVILGVNNKNEVHVMVNTNAKEDMESLVEQIKETFHEYLMNMKHREFKTHTFKDILYRDENHLHEYIVQVDVLFDQLVITHEHSFSIPFNKMNDIYIERRSNVSRSTKSAKDKVMKYALVYENWIIIEAEDTVYGFFGAGVEHLFSALSQAFFIAQMKKHKKE